MDIPAGLSLCVDGGGSSCRTAIAKGGQVIAYHEQAISSNLVAVGLSRVVCNIETTIQAALARAGISEPTWASVVIGLAGLEAADEDQLTELYRTLSSVLPANLLRICRDGDLLSYTLLDYPVAKAAVCFVCGTGSALSLAVRSQDGQPERLSSAGGYGSVLGDDGSGFAIGRLAIRSTLKTLDRLPLNQRANLDKISNFHKAVLEHFGTTSDQSALISSVLQGSSFQRIASVCPVVFQHSSRDQAAAQILQTAASDLAQQVDDLLHSYQQVKAGDTLLIAGGSVIGQASYQDMLRLAMEEGGVAFIDFVHVDNVSKRVAEVLSRVL